MEAVTRVGATAAPRVNGFAQVIELGLRHMAWLAKDDPLVAAELPEGDRWTAAQVRPT